MSRSPGSPPRSPTASAARGSLALFALLAAFVVGVGCVPPRPPDPLPVRPADLVRAYAESPARAKAAYTGVRVVLPVRGFRPLPDGSGWGWALGAAPDSPPVLVAETGPGPPPPDPSEGLWLEADCRGALFDTVRRELPGYAFTVRLTNCRLVPAPGPGPPPRPARP